MKKLCRSPDNFSIERIVIFQRIQWRFINGIIKLACKQKSFILPRITSVSYIKANLLSDFFYFNPSINIFNNADGYIICFFIFEQLQCVQ